MSTENAVGCLLCLSRSLFLVFHSLPCPLGAQGIFSRGFVPKGRIWICHHSNLDVFCISCNMIVLSDWPARGREAPSSDFADWMAGKLFFDQIAENHRQEDASMGGVMEEEEWRTIWRDGKAEEMKERQEE